MNPSTGWIVIEPDRIQTRYQEDGAPACAELITEYEDTLANPYVAAERGYIDAVIDPSHTRVSIIKALRALRTKRKTLPPKKHGNIPL